MKKLMMIVAFCALIGHDTNSAQAAKRRKRLPGREAVKNVIRAIPPLKHPRGKRLPLYVWRINSAGLKADAETETLIRELDRRGIGLISFWYPSKKEQRLAHALKIAKLQQKLGLEVAVMAHPCMHRICNGDPSTFHVAEDGKKFYDDSFAKRVKMGCPFALRHRYAPIHAQVEYFIKGYRAAGVPIHISFADWEIDGPIEWNDAWATSKKCRRCREHVPNIDNFLEFQKSLRAIRSEIQRRCYAEPMKARFPDVLVGNYAVNPHGGYRYWYDYFEKLPEGAPYKADQRARYRPWAHEFAGTGYTYANPVVYTWWDTFNWYDFENTDYRWFYNMLLVASNACEHTPPGTPVIAWVHWHTTAARLAPDPKKIKQFSEEKYQELLWHMLLRGMDTFSSWCTAEELVKEVELLQEVCRDALEYKEFLDKGTPITYHVPKQQGPVISGLKLGNRVLIRRTDFDGTREPVEIKVAGCTLRIPRVEGRCQMLRTEN